MMSRVFHSPPSLPRDPLQGWLFVLPVHLLLTVITNLLPPSPALLSLQKQHPTYSFDLRFKNTFFKIWFSQTTFMNVKSWTEANPSPSLGKKLGAVTCSKQSRQILSSTFILFLRNTWPWVTPERWATLGVVFLCTPLPPWACSITVVLFLLLFVV